MSHHHCAGFEFLDFGHWQFIRDLVFGAWNFYDFHDASKFRLPNQLSVEMPKLCILIDIS